MEPSQIFDFHLGSGPLQQVILAMIITKIYLTGIGLGRYLQTTIIFLNSLNRNISYFNVKETFRRFLDKLSNNNNRDWFKKNKPKFDILNNHIKLIFGIISYL